MARGRAGRRRTTTALAVGALATAVVTGFASWLSGCNAILGIEEQGLRPDAGDDGDAGPPDASRPAFERCSADSDCIAPNACYTPHCDRVLGACTYALCEAKGETCAMGQCDVATSTCTPPSRYGFRSASYSVLEVTSGCGPNPESCVAAAFPFLFLGTRDTVVALRVDDLVASAATKVQLEGFDVKPERLVVSGRRLWALGAPQGAAPPYKLPIAVLDVPSDPTVRTLRATTSFVAYPFPTATAFAAPDGAIYVTHNDAAQGLPTALVQAPVTNDDAFGLSSAADAGVYEAGTPFDAGIAPGGTPPRFDLVRIAGVQPGATMVGSTGARLVSYRNAATSLVEGAGTSNAVARPDQPIAPAPPNIVPPRFAQGPDGVLVFTATANADAPTDCNCTSVSRLQWLFPNAIAPAAESGQLAQYEGYGNAANPASNPPCPNPRACSYFTQPSLVTWIDARSVLAAAPGTGPAGDPARERVAVRLVTRDPITAPITKRVLSRVADKGNFATDRIALTSANGFGYLVLADGQGNGLTVSLFDPRCDVGDAGAP